MGRFFIFGITLYIIIKIYYYFCALKKILYFLL